MGKISMLFFCFLHPAVFIVDIMALILAAILAHENESHREGPYLSPGLLTSKLLLHKREINFC